MSLGTLLMAAQFIDLLWPTMLLLDVIVHQPDLPLYPGSSPLLGMNVWQSLPATLAVELSLWESRYMQELPKPKTMLAGGDYGGWLDFCSLFMRPTCLDRHHPALRRSRGRGICNGYL